MTFPTRPTFRQALGIIGLAVVPGYRAAVAKAMQLEELQLKIQCVLPRERWDDARSEAFRRWRQTTDPDFDLIAATESVYRDALADAL